MVWHNVNAITAQACDFVLSSCPLSALNFQEIGVESVFAPIECSGKILKDYKLKKFTMFYILGEKKLLEMSI